MTLRGGAPGRLQIRILEAMCRNTIGQWPPRWRLNYRDKQLMSRMAEHGYIRIVETKNGIRYIITDIGRELVAAQPKPTMKDWTP